MNAVGIGVLVFILAPIPVIVWMSFFKAEYLSFPPTQGYSTRWYAGLVHQTQLSGAFVYSFELALLAALISTVIGFLAALALHRSTLPGHGAISNAFAMPLTIPTIVSGLALYLYLYSLQQQTQRLLVPTFWALLAAHVLITLPWAFRFIYAGLAGLGRDVERASLDLGRNELATLWHITLPLMRPSLIGGYVLAFIFSFGDLEMSLFLVAPGKVTLPVAMVQYAQFKVDPTLAAMSVVQIAIIATLLLAADRFIHFGRVFAGGTKQ